MGVVLPIVRLLLLFSNFWITFKCLRKPRSKQGDASLRASQQRRRDLKCCLGVWLIWSISTLTEQITDGVLAFMPFYAEVKVFLWLILLFTRSMVAEPLFINLIRPTVKPYVTIMDSCLDLLSAIGELLAALLIWPLEKVRDWWHPRKQVEVAPIKIDNSDASIRRGPTTRSQMREAATQASVVLSEVDAAQQRFREYHASTAGDSTRQPSLRQVLGEPATRPGSSSQQQYELVDPQTLDFDDQPKVPPLRVRKRTLQKTHTRQIDNTLPPPVASDSIVTGYAANSDNVVPVPDASLTAQRWEHVVASRRVSTPDLPSMQADEITPKSPSWSGVYPPLPSAYPATPAQPFRQVVSTSMSQAANELVTFQEQEPYPPFPAAYPITPAPRRVALPVPSVEESPLKVRPLLNSQAPPELTEGVPPPPGGTSAELSSLQSNNAVSTARKPRSHSPSFPTASETAGQPLTAITTGVPALNRRVASDAQKSATNLHAHENAAKVTNSRGNGQRRAVSATFPPTSHTVRIAQAYEEMSRDKAASSSAQLNGRKVSATMVHATELAKSQEVEMPKHSTVPAAESETFSTRSQVPTKRHLIPGSDTSLPRTRSTTKLDPTGFTRNSSSDMTAADINESKSDQTLQSEQHIARKKRKLAASTVDSAALSLEPIPVDNQRIWDVLNPRRGFQPSNDESNLTDPLHLVVDRRTNSTRDVSAKRVQKPELKPAGQGKTERATRSRTTLTRKES